MRNTWKKTAAFLLAFTLVAVPLSQTGVKGGLFSNIGIVASAAETLLYSQNYENDGVEVDWTSSTSGRYSPIIAEEDGNHYITVNQDKRNNNGCTLSSTSLSGIVQSGTDFDLNFDFKLGSGNNQGSSLKIYDANNTGVILSLATPSANTNQWKVNDGDTITLSETGGGKALSELGWYSLKLKRRGNNELLTIVSKTDNTVVLLDEEISGSELGGLGKIEFKTGRYKANFAIDNILVVSIAEEATDISNATVNLGDDNSVSSITVGDDTITDLSGFDITYGVSDTDHTATAVPTDAGTYYAYVTAKDTNTAYTGTAKSASFDVAAAPTISSASVTLNDGFGLNFYVDNITDAADYTVMFDGACDENGTQVALTEKDGKFFATANVNAKDFKENIAATLYKDGVATDVTLTSSVDAYLTAALATDGLNDKTKAMVTSAQLYGLAADEYFNGTDNNVAARIAAYMTAANISDTAINATLTPYAPTFTSDDAKVSMVLNSKIKLRVYSDNGASENGFGKYSEAAGLTPLTLAQPQAIDGFTVSGYTWVYRVLNNTASEAKDVNMAKALFAYMTAAKNLAVVDVASVTLDQSALTLTAGGDTATLTATVLPENATDKTVTWSSDNEAVATVDADGKVTAVAAGTANITATANDGSGVTATCAVTVTPAAITVTWNNNDITGTWESSFTKDGVTITAENIDFEDKNFMEGGTFTTTLGNFTKIEVTTASFEASGTGWSGSTWTGNASSVSFSGNIMGCGFGNTKFVFTIEPTN